MTCRKLLLGTVAVTLLTTGPAFATELNFFCTNQSNPALNPEGDGVIVQAIVGNKLQSLHVVHKVNGRLYDRTTQYEDVSLKEDPSGFPSYFWEGLMIKDQNVVMTGHLWENAGVWLYDEHQAFRDGSPTKLATPPVMCEARSDEQKTALTDGPGEHQATAAPGVVEAQLKEAALAAQAATDAKAMDVGVTGVHAH
jgi:hypothetical protein